MSITGVKTCIFQSKLSSFRVIGSNPSLKYQVHIFDENLPLLSFLMPIGCGFQRKSGFSLSGDKSWESGGRGPVGLHGDGRSSMSLGRGVISSSISRGNEDSVSVMTSQSSILGELKSEIIYLVGLHM